MAQRTLIELIGLRDGVAETAHHALRSLKKAPPTVQEWMRVAPEGSDFGLWYWNEQTKGLVLDLKAREMFGVNLKGKVTLGTFYKAIHPDDLPNVKKTWRHRLENGLPYDIEYRSLRPDGSARWVKARGRGYYGESNEPLYMIGVVFDVTERKQAQQEREELSGRLIDAQERERSRRVRSLG